jgi:hypothetical protein
LDPKVLQQHDCRWSFAFVEGAKSELGGKAAYRAVEEIDKAYTLRE